MKNILTLLILFYALNSGIAQSQLKYKHEFGFNVNILLNSMVFENHNNQDQLFVPQDNLLAATYRLYSSPDFAYRFGGGIYNKTRIDTTVSSFFTATDTHELTYFAFQLGIQQRFNISKIVKPYIGIEYIFRYEKNSIEHYESGLSFGISGTEWEYENKRTDFYQRHGLGIPIGFQIFISDRISISTESNLEFIFEKRENKYEEDNQSFGSSNHSTHYKTKSVNWKLPLAVFVNLGF